ncbi:MAG: HAMP domain-containing histidine kinase [Anaerolineales bacterium]|nr:HAMP domain-containing histidine kinase [Anaerolineales bacterium]
MNQASDSPFSTRLGTLANERLRQFHCSAYALLAPDLTLREVSDYFHAYMSEPGEIHLGRHVGEYIWELVGAEPWVEQLLSGELDEVRLDQINRVQEKPCQAALPVFSQLSEGSTARAGSPDLRYISMELCTADPTNPQDGLLLIIEDTTYASSLEQRLLQERNDLRLAQEDLAQANEELKRLNRMKSLFLSVAAHDLRTPLTAILGYTDMVRNSLPKDIYPQSYEFLTVVSEQVNWMDRLISDLLDLDQIEQGRLILRPRLCNLATLAERAVTLLKESARLGDKQVRLEVEDVFLPIWADEDRFYRVLLNLLGNAIKYTPRGGEITLSAWRDRDAEANRQLVFIQVKDNGPGMTPEEQAQLFQLYYRTDTAQGSKIRGTGLGLFIVKSLVDAHGGSITVASQQGVGSAFTISLPLRDQNPTVGVGEANI